MEAVGPRPYERAHIYNGIKNQVPNEPQQKPAPKPKAGSTAPDKRLIYPLVTIYLNKLLF